MSSRDRRYRSPRRSDLRLPSANQRDGAPQQPASTEDQIRSLRESLVRNRQYPRPEPTPTYDEDEVYQTDTYQAVDNWEDDYVEQAPAYSTRPSRQSSNVRQPAYTQEAEEVWEDYEVAPADEYADESWDYDDQDQGWDDYEEQPVTRRRARAQASRPQVRVPSLSRPTLPPAIANAALVADRTAMMSLGAAVLGLIALAILVANRASTLDPAFASHVSASGVLEHFKTSSSLWLLPLMASMVTLMNLVIAWFVSPTDRFASRFVLGAALVVQFMVWVAVIRILY